MKRVWAASVLPLAIAALGSCSDNGAESDDGMDYAAFTPMKAGLWETKFVFSEINVPTLGKSQKKQIMDEVAKGASGRSCLSEADAKKPAANFFGGSGAEKCRYTAFDVSGRNVTMKLSCAMDGTGAADLQLSGVMGVTAFDYTSMVDVRLPMVGKVKMKGNAIGKYVGECPAA